MKYRKERPAGEPQTRDKPGGETMTSFSSEDTSTSGSSRHRDAPGSLFVGSFNINASDLSKTDAMAWLARAVDADVVAIGLQVAPSVFTTPGFFGNDT